MKNSFINIGNKAFVSMDMIKCIVAADSDKVRRILARANLTRTSPNVIDTTSDKETRSIIFLNYNFFRISSVNATILAQRARSYICEIIDQKNSSQDLRLSELVK